MKDSGWWLDLVTLALLPLSCVAAGFIAALAGSWLGQAMLNLGFPAYDPVIWLGQIMGLAVVCSIAFPVAYRIVVGRWPWR